MSYILTLVTSSNDKPIAERHLKQVTQVLSAHDIVQTCAPVWLAPEKVADLGLSEKPGSVVMKDLQEMLEGYEIDVFTTNIERRRKKLVICDMDSTIVSGETLDELADHAGLKDKVAHITAQAMEGELDFQSALRERVSLLKGLPEDTLQKVLEKITLNPGAETMIKTMMKNGAYCVLVSGGFSHFTSAIASKLGFHAHHGNNLVTEKGVITGKVIEPILDKFSKREFLQRYINELSIDARDTLAIGDGANDIPMLKDAGMGIGYQPKGAVKEEIDNLIIHGNLTAALYAQGYNRSEFTLKNQ